jgi:peptide/nickel transport system permease protein
MGDAPAGPAHLPATPGRILLRRLGRHPLSLAGAAIVIAYAAMALLAPTIAPYDPVRMLPGQHMVEPSLRFLLGTDEFGRDILSRVLHGSRVSLSIAVASVAIALAIGTTAGVAAGLQGRGVDNAIMRVMDVIFAFPAILLALFVVAILGPGTRQMVAAIGLVFAPQFARVARAAVLATRHLDYVEAARALGASGARVVTRHILPNISAPVIVQVSVTLSLAILTESALSFLGLGTQPPAPSWGSMLSSARRFMELAPWVAISPGAAIMGIVLGFNLLGDGLRDLLDPRLR